MTATKQFHLAAIISATTDTLFQVPGTKYPIDGVREMVDYITQDSNQTFMLGSAADECIPYLQEQLPFVREIVFAEGEVTVNNWRRVLDDLCAKYGAFHAVRPMHPEDHEVIDPANEMTRNYPDATVIVIPTDAE